MDMLTAVKQTPPVQPTPLQCDSHRSSSPESSRAKLSRDGHEGQARSSRMPSRGSGDNLAELLGAEDDDSHDAAAGCASFTLWTRAGAERSAA